MVDFPQHVKLIAAVEAETSPTMRAVLRRMMDAPADSGLFDFVPNHREAFVGPQILDAIGVDLSELQAEKRRMAEESGR